MGRKERRNYLESHTREVKRALKEWCDLPTWSVTPSFREDDGEWVKLKVPLHDGYDLKARIAANCPKSLREDAQKYLDYIYNDRRPIHSSGKNFRYCDSKGQLLWRYKGYADSALSYYYREDKTLDFEKAKNVIYIGFTSTHDLYETYPFLENFTSRTEIWSHGHLIRYDYDVYPLPPTWVELYVCPHYRYYKWVPNSEKFSRAKFLKNRYDRTREFEKYAYKWYHSYWTEGYDRTDFKRETQKIIKNSIE